MCTRAHTLTFCSLPWCFRSDPVDNAFATNVSYSVGRLTSNLQYDLRTPATAVAKRRAQGRNWQSEQDKRWLVDANLKKKYMSFQYNRYISGKPFAGFEPWAGGFNRLVMFSDIITALRVPISWMLRRVGWYTVTIRPGERNLSAFRVQQSKKRHRSVRLDCLAPKTETLRSSETSVTVYPSTRRNMPEDFNFHHDPCDKLRPRIITSFWEPLRRTKNSGVGNM
jgi:hypothetical protein